MLIWKEHELRADNNMVSYIYMCVCVCVCTYLYIACHQKSYLYACIYILLFAKKFFYSMIA
jgi:tryptophan-rich sensory protein